MYIKKRDLIVSNDVDARIRIIYIFMKKNIEICVTTVCCVVGNFFLSHLCPFGSDSVSSLVFGFIKSNHTNTHKA